MSATSHAPRSISSLAMARTGEHAWVTAAAAEIHHDFDGAADPRRGAGGDGGVRHLPVSKLDGAVRAAAVVAGAPRASSSAALSSMPSSPCLQPPRGACSGTRARTAEALAVQELQRDGGGGVEGQGELMKTSAAGRATDCAGPGPEAPELAHGQAGRLPGDEERGRRGLGLRQQRLARGPVRRRWGALARIVFGLRQAGRGPEGELLLHAARRAARAEQRQRHAQRVRVAAARGEAAPRSGAAKRRRGERRLRAARW